MPFEAAHARSTPAQMILSPGLLLVQVIFPVSLAFVEQRGFFLNVILMGLCVICFTLRFAFPAPSSNQVSEEAQD